MRAGLGLAAPLVRRRLPRAALAIGAGAFMGLGHSPYDLPWLLFLALPLLYHLAAAGGGARAAAVTGWLGGVGYFALTLSWIVEPFLVDVARTGWMAPFALVFLAGGLALFWGLAFWVAFRLPCRPALRPFLLALCLALAGLLRAYVLTGFPWALPAYAWIETPVAQAAAWLGPHGLGLALMSLALLLTEITIARVAFAAAGLALLWGAGTARLGGAGEAGGGLIVRLVQPNAAQELKWRPDMMAEFYRRLIRYTQAPGEGPVDLVIWPETAVPFILGERPDLMADIAFAAGDRAPVILGIRRIDEAGDWFNSLAAVGPGGELLAAYDKQHLVPFGEYMPLSGLLERLGIDGLVAGLAGGFAAGPGPRRIEIPGVPAFQPLICYEAIFPHEILGGGDRPDWLVQITNDAWFGTWSGPYQHLAQARFRAIEQGLPLARAANTGISAMVGPRGEMLGALALNSEGYIDRTLPAPLPPTLYAQSGDWLFLALAGLGLGAILRVGRRRAG